MSLDQLVAALEHRVADETETLLAEARSEASSIQVEVEERLTRRRAVVLAQIEAERDAAVEQRLRDARRTARRLVLDARASVLDRVFTAARARFEEVQASPEYRDTLAGQVAEAFDVLGDRPVTLRSPPTLADKLQRVVAGRPAVAVRADPAVGCGFTATADDGSVEVDATLEGRLGRLQPSLAIEILARVDAQA